MHVAKNDQGALPTPSPVIKQLIDINSVNPAIRNSKFPPTPQQREEITPQAEESRLKTMLRK
jgi:hypothetical protein